MEPFGGYKWKSVQMQNGSMGMMWMRYLVGPARFVVMPRSLYGQILAQTGTLSSQLYSYDKAGRLTLVKDTPQGGGCTTRSYSYDADSNRTALITRQPSIGGACDTSSAGTTQSYSYDAADRLLGGGIAYDNFGRITSLPSAE